ncbi:uncharacterized protein LOC115315977 [Ixodes scapularis]|uniref:uncharacterized protein LOC115315977 n=1 Tax=Ixodes scapularis TaxID=6945 RepID=UPI001A9E806A|nr:uncharacterized protein LOC115315977 [Ixodes scapularis]
MKDPDHRDWDVKLKQAECSLNNAVNKTTGKTPFELLQGYKPSFYGIALPELYSTQPKYRGPLVVTEVLPADTYRVAELD